jgi:hypothetical protein
MALHSNDKEKTALFPGQGLCHFTVSGFLDDVIVVGRTFLEQLANLRKVFQRFRGAHLKLNPGKCLLFQKDVRHVRNIVSPERVTADRENLEAVQHCPPRRDRQELSFQGL